MSYLAAFCGLLALQLSVKEDIISYNLAILLGYILGLVIGFFK